MTHDSQVRKTPARFNTTYNLHIQREQTICQKRIEQKIATERKETLCSVYSAITTDLFIQQIQTHFAYILLQRPADSSKLRSKPRYLKAGNLHVGDRHACFRVV